ncbi:hypothetical protein QBC39DRAFT_178929 [Podospora conica]|nr:hypothetical protein QBC39DRAFT_178929 [Schizothecium conicum]
MPASFPMPRDREPQTPKTRPTASSNPPCRPEASSPPLMYNESPDDPRGSPEEKISNRGHTSASFDKMNASHDPSFLEGQSLRRASATSDASTLHPNHDDAPDRMLEEDPKHGRRTQNSPRPVGLSDFSPGHPAGDKIPMTRYSKGARPLETLPDVTGGAEYFLDLFGTAGKRSMNDNNDNTSAWHTTRPAKVRKVMASDTPIKPDPSVDLTPSSPEPAEARSRTFNHPCLASPTAPLTRQCVADLLKMVVAGNPTVCIADTSGTATRYMLETGCLKLAGTSAKMIFLPLNVFSDHWTLAVIPLTDHRPIELFDSLKSTTRPDAAKGMVADFLKQLAANWPPSADGGRCLPAGLTRNPPRIVTRTGPLQHNDYDDCGVYIVMAAMFIVTGNRLPESCHLGLWRRLFCLLSLEPRQHPPVPQDHHVMSFLEIHHADWNNVNPRGCIPTCPTRPQEPVAWTERGLEEYLQQITSYIQQLERCYAEYKARRVESAQRLEETLADMDCVVAALRSGLRDLSHARPAPEAAHGVGDGDGDGLGSIMDFAQAVVQQALEAVGKLVCQDETEIGLLSI